jgi:putative alpha-1,2-mannosidase
VRELTYGNVTADGGYAFGDEDQGQMGGVSVLLSIGLFSPAGACETPPRFDLTTPIFDEIVIHLDPAFCPGKTFTLRCRNQAPENHYIQSARLEGKPLERCWITHRELSAGGLVELDLGPVPNKAWPRP